MPRPGDVYYLPPREGDLLDPNKGDRPHLALSLCNSSSTVLTVAYGSTKQTEAAKGAACVLVEPSRATGLSAPTYFYPSRLVSIEPGDLSTPAGRVDAEMAAIRDALRKALGLGSGTATERYVGGTNRRGRVAALTNKLRDLTGVAHALVVTEPGYSRLGRQQTIVPMLPESGFETDDLDVVAPAAGWTRFVTGSREPIILASSMIFTVFEREGIDHYTEGVVDPITMHRLDKKLATHFGL